MNKTLLYTIAFTTLCASTAFANLDNKDTYYLKLNYGQFPKGSIHYTTKDDVSLANEKLMSSDLLEGALGYVYDDTIAFELAINKMKFKTKVTFANADTFSSNFSSTGIYLNYYAHRKILDSNFSPYFTIGIGATQNKAIIEGLHFNNHNSFAWNTGMGINYKLNENLALDFNIKYYDLGKMAKEYLVRSRGAALKTGLVVYL
jgi:opacity protein-like surface antigen